MKKPILAAAAFLIASHAYALTANRVVKASSNTYITDSIIQDDGTGVGIGTAPVSGQKLAVDGTIKSISGGFVFPDGSTQTVAAGVTAGDGLTGGGTSGSVTLAVDSDVLKRQWTISLDGAGSVLTEGSKSIGFRVPYPVTLTGWQLVSYPETSTATVKVDLWYSAFGTFPTSADSIVGGSTPTLNSLNFSSGTCSGWDTVDLDEGYSLEVSVLSGVEVSTKTVLSLFGTVR